MPVLGCLSHFFFPGGLVVSLTALLFDWTAMQFKAKTQQRHNKYVHSFIVPHHWELVYNYAAFTSWVWPGLVCQ